jgi:hypothetical protein
MSAGVGEKFARALAAKDAAAMKAVLAPQVEFRALTPNRYWEASGPDEVVDGILLSQWFEDHDRILGVLHIESGGVGARHHVAYRFALECPDGPYQVEQQAYFDTEGGQITWLRVLCSGFQPIELP